MAMLLMMSMMAGDDWTMMLEEFGTEHSKSRNYCRSLPRIVLVIARVSSPGGGDGYSSPGDQDYGRYILLVHQLQEAARR
jgi:hypothetical protein